MSSLLVAVQFEYEGSTTHNVFEHDARLFIPAGGGLLDFSRLEREVREAVTDVDNVVSSVVFGPEEQVLRVLLLLAGEAGLVVRDSGERLDQELELERFLVLARVELDPLLTGCTGVCVQVSTAVTAQTGTTGD